MATKNVGILAKISRLGLAALVSAVIGSTYYYFTHRDQLYWVFRCFNQGTNISSCFRGDNFDFTTDLFGMRYEGNTGNYIDRHILYVGAYEKPLLFLIRDIMKSAFANQGVFIDVGANTGQHSLFMSHYSKEVHAFEPYEPVLKKFRRMVEINSISNIEIHPVGLGSAHAKLPFHKPPDSNLGTGSFVEGFKPDNSYFGELEIQVGDEALKKAGVQSVALIKIDIEGYEKLALQGLQKTLQSFRPFVVFELTTNPQSPVSVKNKLELTSLFPESYDFVVISEDQGLMTGEYQLVNPDAHVHFDKLEQHDLLAYPTEKKKYLARGGSSR